MDVLMAIFDFIPVTLFLIAGICYQRALYNKMSKGAFALFSTGTITVFIAGVFKATYKLLGYGFGINFASLNSCFFPMQTVGFVLCAAGLLAMILYKQGEGKEYAISFPILIILASGWMEKEEYKGTMIFVALMVLGVAIMNGVLIYIAKHLKSVKAIILLVVAFVCILAMGYLSTKEDMSDWIKEIVNTIGQLSLLLSALVLKKKGLDDANSLSEILK